MHGNERYGACEDEEMAAEANRITYGNWRLSCWAAAFFIHKTISRNGGINMKELWNTAQVIFAAIGGWLG